MEQLSYPQRLYLGAVAALAAWVGVWCYFVPARSDFAIPWLVPPLCAGFLGAMYLSGAVFTGSCMLARRWTDVRVVMPMIALWTGGLTVISLFHLRAFDFSRGQVIVWFGAYIAFPLIALGLLWTHRAQRSIHPLNEPRLPQWVRTYLLVQGSIMILIGLCLLVAPRAMGSFWAWKAGPLMLQLYSAPLLSYGIGSFILARQYAWSEIRLALAAMAVFTGAELAACIRYGSLLNGPTLSITLWFALLASTTIVLVTLSVIAFRLRTILEHERPFATMEGDPDLLMHSKANSRP